MVEELISGDNSAIPVLGVDNLSEYVSDIAGIFYADPSAKMCLTAITGTNGKTTCSRLFADLMEGLADERAGTAAFIGTLGYGMVRNAAYRAPHDSAEPPADQSAPSFAYKEQAGVTDTGLTTPDAVAMQRILAELASKGAKHIALEVSSHSLVQRRVAGLKINTAVFTNLSRDHLDYHGDINAYAAAKSRLFAMQGLQHAVINSDDSVGRVILANLDRIRLKVKGNGEKYHIFIQTTIFYRLPTSYKIATFDTSPNWETVDIPFNKFKKLKDNIDSNIRAKDIKTFGIVAYGRDFKSDLSVSSVEFYY